MDKLQKQYEAALTEYLAEGGETALQRAYDLARDAIGQGRGVSDLVAVHQDTMIRAVAATSTQHSPALLLNTSWNFFLECLSVFDMAQRGYQEANETLHQLNETLEQRIEKQTSELRESESRKGAILEAALDGIITIDHEGGITEFNPAAEEIFGFSRAQALGQQMAELIIPPSLRESHYQGLARYLDTGEGPVIDKRIEMTAMRADGSEFPVELAITPLRLDRAPMFTGFVRDITDRQRAEEDRNRMLLELERLSHRLLYIQEEERRQIAYDIHDGPTQEIVAAHMYLETYRSEKRQKESPQVEGYLEQAQSYLADAVKDCRRIISDLRPTILDDFGLAEALRQYLEEVRARTDRQLEFQTDLYGMRLDVSVETALFRIAQEAVTNAIKHSASDRIAVSLLKSASRLALEVRDWGRGFDTEQMPASSGGRQVGLFSLKERAQLIGGELTIDSTPGEGTTIMVTLPLLQEEEEDEGRLVAMTQRNNNKPLKLDEGDDNRIRVLIADDHPMVRQGLSSMLNTKGIELIGEAADGGQAVKLARELNPDVILMDVRMPDMDGLTATEIIKQEAPAISVIVVTSYESKDYLRKAIEAGAAGYLLKGMARESLIEAIRLVKGGGSLIDAKLLAELLQDMGVQDSRFQGTPEGALEALTPREQEVLQLLVRGLTNKEIATEMHYSVGTVKNVVQRVIEKLGVSDRTQAAVYAVRAGLHG